MSDAIAAPPRGGASRKTIHPALIAAAIGTTLLTLAGAAWAQDATAPPTIDKGDTAWMMVATALVMSMTAPGLALFYGGLVRAKNMLSVLMQCMVCLAVISIQWILFGYTLAFGATQNGFIGGLDFLGLSGVGATPNADYAATLPHLTFMMYQGTFAVITPALIVGAFAERMKFSAFLLFTTLWAILIYDPLAHWVWGVGGWIRGLGALDFAGGTVVHISSGISALAAALLIGKRIGHGHEPMPPHNLPFTVAGAALLWFGWFGFNAGSALAADGVAANAFVTTNTGAAAATLGWIFIEWITRGKPTVLGAASGAVAGLVSITPGAGFVTPMGAIAIGFLGGIICFYGIQLKEHLGADDALDVVGVHGVGGTWGALATGIFATKAVNAAGADGLLYGNPGQLVTQAIGVGATLVYCFIGAFILLKVTDVLVGLRATDEDEFAGLDLSQHSERAYMLGSVAE
ncbi:ammonium transporter [Candidatus Binatia bacterium]|jgi:Amt family ammonium transporter|nr:ammonium transporter [Candidatus Binatia bacterium]